jgi:hypothetical protein
MIDIKVLTMLDTFSGKSIPANVLRTLMVILPNISKSSRMKVSYEGVALQKFERQSD